MTKKFLALVLFSFTPLFLFATHNRAGEIFFEHINNYTYKITVYTYTKESSVAADRDSLVVHYVYLPSHTEFTDTVVRTNGPDVAPANGEPDGEILGNDIKMNIYVSYYTFPGFGDYIIYMQDLNRISGIINILGAVDQPFYVEDTLHILDPQFYPFNNSPILTNPPIDFAVRNDTFIHIPGAYDPDGDSLHFEFIVPKAALGLDVASYTQPNLVAGTVGNPTLTINPYDGVIEWSTPQQCGIYNIAILITEYRRVVGQPAIKIGTLIRDMEIIVVCVPDHQPEIVAMNDTCVVAGSLLTLKVRSTDPDAGQTVTVTANGGPFEVDPPDTAMFIPDPDTIGYGTFVWQTVCNHIRSQPYQVVFHAQDNYADTPLVDLESWLIKVVAPAPENLVASPLGNNITVSWNSPYECYDAKRFIGFSLWRREGSSPFTPDTCNPTMSGKGYTKIAARLRVYSYLDNHVERGKEYCYRVEAEFADTTTVPNFLLNFCEGLPSNEDCAVLKKDVPVITNASVLNTDVALGKIYVAWSKPNAVDLDTIQNPGPYDYKLYHSSGFSGANLTLIHSITALTFSLLIDTTYIDTLINTIDKAWSYRISFFSDGDSIGETEIASSVYVTAIGQDNKVALSWNENVPWTNTLYTVYRFDSGIWDSIGITSTQAYTDLGLTNDSTYCYYVRSTGGYSAPGIIFPIINLSQQVCAVPVDTVGPCPPTLQVTNDCLDDGFLFGSFNNLLSWNTVTDVCADDLLHYNVYYTATEGGAFKLIDSSLAVGDTSFIHHLENTVAGCYYITGTDSNYNEGTASTIICVNNCPLYKLPNVFTPNGDDQNDLYHPILPIKYIEKIDIKIFDSWGVPVFETTDPMINWNGVNSHTGKMCADGTYYYVCDVYEQSLQGSTKWSKPLSGFIHLYQ